MATLRGHVTVVQEQRFRLAAADGRSYLFTLSHRAAASPADLCRLRDDGTAVLVEYAGEPNLASGVASTVRPA